MAKKSVIIFDGEDKFINPKKAVYSKTRGQSKKFESFKSLRASLQDEEGPTQSSSEQVADAPTYSGSMYTAPAVEAQPSSGGSYIPESSSQTYIPNIAPREPIAESPIPVIDSPAELLNRFSPVPSVEDDRKTTMPIYEAPPQFISQPITQEPPYVAPVPDLPSNPRLDDEFRKTIMPIYEAPPQYISQPITQEPPSYSAPIVDDRKTIMPIYEAPPQFISQPITQEPPYVAPVPDLPSNPRLDDEFRKTIMPIYESPIAAPSPITQEPRLDDFIPKRPPRLDDALPPSNEIPPNSSPIGGRYPIDNIINPNPYQPIYTAPVPPINDSPERSCPAGMRLFNGTCIPQDALIRDDDFLPKRGIPDERVPITPTNPYQPNPIYTAPVPILPTPPPAKIIGDPMGGGGSPVMGSPEIPRPKCPTGFVYNDTTGMCIDKRNPDTEIDPIVTRTTSSTTTTTTKAAAAVPTTTSSTTTTTTKAAVVDKTCNPPMYAAPKYYKWVSKGNCAYELVVDDTQLKDAAPAPVLPATGQPIININYPTGGLGTIPLPTTSTSTTVQTTTKSLLPLAEDSGGSGGGGGGGSPFPEEPAPIVAAPKKNYFWWYVGGALAIYLLMKRKNKQ